MIGAIRNWSSGAREALAARPDRVRAAVEAALAAALIVQLGRLAWIAVEPVDLPAAVAARPQAQPVDYSVFQRFDAFFRTGGESSLAGDAAAGASQMRLFGVRSDGAGGGSAIIGLADGRQIAVAVGETIEPGLVLQSVGADHVVLARGASLSRLVFGELPVGAAPPPPPPPGPQTVTPDPAPAAAAAPTVDPARLITPAALRPRMQGLRLNGFTIAEGVDAGALDAAGLQAGDVILAVNGVPLDSPSRIAALRGQLANAASAEIRFERDGAAQTTTIRTGR